MSYRLSQLSPRTSTRGFEVKLAVHRAWGSSPGSPDAQFLRTWLEDDSDLDANAAEGGINWGALSGLALAIVVSATFWTGVGWIVAHIWR